MKTKHYTLGFLLLTILCISCQKKPEDTCVTSVASISGAYKLTTLQYKLNASAPAQDYLVFMDACEKDDIITLKTDGTYTYQDAGTVCTPNGSDNGTWTLSGSVINSDGVVDGIIESFDCHTLVFYAKDVYTPGDRLTFTIVKQ
jgi:hypothetical protein